MIDQEGYRANIAIVLTNTEGHVAWFKRTGQAAWQFPQGGLHANETPEMGMFRELHEETGLTIADVEILGQTKEWLYYELPEKLIKKDGACIGQKQIWFLLQLKTTAGNINLQTSDRPEFESWCWCEKQRALEEVVFFKKTVYEKALAQLDAYWP